VRRDDYRRLQQQRIKAHVRMRELHNGAERRNGGHFTTAEQDEWDQLEAEVRRLDLDIAEGREQLDAEQRSNGGAEPVEYSIGGTRVGSQLVEAMRQVQKGETRALSTATGISQGELSNTLFDRLRAQSIFLRTGVTVLRTDADSVSYPVVTADVTPGQYAEAQLSLPPSPSAWLSSSLTVPSAGYRRRSWPNTSAVQLEPCRTTTVPACRTLWSAPTRATVRRPLRPG
jgi:HK97 family phage major capsid protein